MELSYREAVVLEPDRLEVGSPYFEPFIVKARIAALSRQYDSGVRQVSPDAPDYAIACEAGQLLVRHAWT